MRVCVCLAALLLGSGAPQRRRADATPPAAETLSASPDAWPPRHENVAAWVITLDRTPLRYKLFTQTSYAHQVFPKLVKFGAVDGLTIDLHTDARISAAGRVGILRGERRSHSGLATRGMAGLYISHVEAWRAFLETDAEVGIVFEDDASVPSDAAERFDGVLSTMPSPAEWDVWLLGVVKVLEQRPPSRMFGPGWSRVTNWFGTQAYLVTRRGAARLLDHAYPMTAQIDAYMAYMSALGEVVTVHRSDGRVDFPQFGVWAGTTVQQLYCDTCDLPPAWNRRADEAYWKWQGALGGAVAAVVPWALVLSVVMSVGGPCKRGGCGGGCACCGRAAHFTPLSPASQASATTSDD